MLGALYLKQFSRAPKSAADLANTTPVLQRVSIHWRGRVPPARRIFVSSTVVRQLSRSFDEIASRYRLVVGSKAVYFWQHLLQAFLCLRWLTAKVMGWLPRVNPRQPRSKPTQNGRHALLGQRVSVFHRALGCQFVVIQPNGNIPKHEHYKTGLIRPYRPRACLHPPHRGHQEPQPQVLGPAPGIYVADTDKFELLRYSRRSQACHGCERPTVRARNDGQLGCLETGSSRVRLAQAAGQLNIGSGLAPMLSTAEAPGPRRSRARVEQRFSLLSRRHILKQAG